MSMFNKRRFRAISLISTVLCSSAFQSNKVYAIPPKFFGNSLPGDQEDIWKLGAGGDLLTSYIRGENTEAMSTLKEAIMKDAIDTIPEGMRDRNLEEDEYAKELKKTSKTAITGILEKKDGRKTIRITLGVPSEILLGQTTPKLQNWVGKRITANLNTDVPVGVWEVKNNPHLVYVSAGNGRNDALSWVMIAEDALPYHKKQLTEEKESANENKLKIENLTKKLAESEPKLTDQETKLEKLHILYENSKKETTISEDEKNKIEKTYTEFKTQVEKDRKKVKSDKKELISERDYLKIHTEEIKKLEGIIKDEETQIATKEDKTTRRENELKNLSRTNERGWVVLGGGNYKTIGDMLDAYSLHYDLDANGFITEIRFGKALYEKVKGTLYDENTRKENYNKWKRGYSEQTNSENNDQNNKKGKTEINKECSSATNSLENKDQKTNSKQETITNILDETDRLLSTYETFTTEKIIKDKSAVNQNDNNSTKIVDNLVKKDKEKQIGGKLQFLKRNLRFIIPAFLAISTAFGLGFGLTH